MVHELDRLRDGAVFSVRDTPWHREGAVLADAPSLQEALRLGGFDLEMLEPRRARIGSVRRRRVEVWGKGGMRRGPPRRARARLTQLWTEGAGHTADLSAWRRVLNLCAPITCMGGWVLSAPGEAGGV